MNKEPEAPEIPEVTEGYDMDNPPSVSHNWVDRGLKVSCENAGHPQHESWKIKSKWPKGVKEDEQVTLCDA